VLQSRIIGAGMEARQGRPRDKANIQRHLLHGNGLRGDTLEREEKA
jgi:hypothetical protein